MLTGSEEGILGRVEAVVVMIAVSHFDPHFFDVHRTDEMAPAEISHF